MSEALWIVLACAVALALAAVLFLERRKPARRESRTEKAPWTRYEVREVSRAEVERAARVHGAAAAVLDDADKHDGEVRFYAGPGTWALLKVASDASAETER